MIVEPPFEAGAVNATEARPLPGVAVPIVGAPGTVAGIADTGLLEVPCPTAFTAATVKSYDVPFVKPVTVAVVEVEIPSAKIDHVELAVGLKFTM